jgi:outer membrane protein OmpA-like peptidoglycan-associated protein
MSAGGRAVLPIVAGLLLLLAGRLPADAQQNPDRDTIIRALAPKVPPPSRSWRQPSRGITVEEEPKVSPETETIDLFVNFEFGLATLTTDARITLRNLGEALRSDRLKAYSFELAGHTDAVGSDESNMILSKRRAESVRSFLVDYYQIEPARLRATGFGESRLLLPGSPDDGANRRVQITNIGRE